MFSKIKNHHYTAISLYLFKWLLLALIVGISIGAACALFLITLEWCTQYRENNTYIIWFLPIAGFLIGASYYYWGKSVVKGNNQIIDEYHNPEKIIPFKMAPLVLLGTLGTHLFGGSAGREGTAVQIGAAIADQCSRFVKLNSLDRKLFLTMGISAGFAAVFGTPLAGAIFALEVVLIGRIRFEALVPSILVAIIADQACVFFGGTHTHYSVNIVPSLSLINIVWVCIAGILFGLTGSLFAKGSHFWGSQFKTLINYPPLRPVIGGLIIAVIVYFMGTTKYIGLGVPTIVESFTQQVPSYDFILKLLLTTFTLGAGFKGGEVTPLFFIGATLGNALVWFIPLPIDVLAAMGFVSVFAGATNTPIACTLMGIELFGIEVGQYVALACFTAYLFSGHSSIYSSQIIGSAKHPILNIEKGKLLSIISQFRKNK